MDKETVNHPDYYKTGGIEAIDVIEAWNLGFCLGNTVKYISRAGRKNPEKEIEDLKKARWYLDRHISDKCPQSDTSAESTPVPICKLREKQSFDIADFMPRLGSVIFIVWGAICILAEEYTFGGCLMLIGVVSRLILSNYHLLNEIRRLKAESKPVQIPPVEEEIQTESDTDEDKSE